MTSGATAHPRFSMTASGSNLELRGEFDMAAADALRDELRAHAEVTAPRVEVDCREVAFMDSSGLAVLLEVQRELQPRGAAIVLRNVPSLVRRTISITRLDDHVTVE